MIANISLTYTEATIILPDNLQLKKLIGWEFWLRTTPTPDLQASISTVNSSSKSGNTKIGAETIAVFSYSKLFVASSPQWKLSFFNKSVIGPAIEEYPLINLQ